MCSGACGAASAWGQALAVSSPARHAKLPRMSLAIEVVSDVVCPWCFIGKRRLEGALALYAAAHPAAPRPRVTWRPFQLNPGMPLQGMPRREYIARKFGGDGAAVYGRVAAVGREVGIAFAFDRI